MLLLVIVNVLVFLLPTCFSRNLPSYFPRCPLDDPGLNNCIGRAANALRPYIRKGIKEIKFPSLDPYVVPIMMVKQESNLVNYTGIGTNFTTRGLDHYDLTEVRYDPKTMMFNGSIAYESLSISTIYIIQGRLLTIPIEGNGTARAALGSINATYEIKGEIVKRNGIEYYNPIKTKVRMVVEDGSYYFDGLFDGNKEVERMTNEMINRNSKAITDAITPVFEHLAEMGLMYLMKSLTQAVPYEILFSQEHKSENS